MNELRELIKSHIVMVHEWLDEIVRENTDVIDESVRDALERVVVKMLLGGGINCWFHWRKLGVVIRMEFCNVEFVVVVRREKRRLC